MLLRDTTFLLGAVNLSAPTQNPNLKSSNIENLKANNDRNDIIGAGMVNLGLSCFLNSYSRRWPGFYLTFYSMEFFCAIPCFSTRWIDIWWSRIPKVVRKKDMAINWPKMPFFRDYRNIQIKTLFFRLYYKITFLI